MSNSVIYQIFQEILYEIRKSKFIIAELTGHNNRAYYEASYAAGLGRVIFLMIIGKGITEINILDTNIM